MSIPPVSGPPSSQFYEPPQPEDQLFPLINKMQNTLNSDPKAINTLTTQMDTIRANIETNQAAWGSNYSDVSRIIDRVSQIVHAYANNKASVRDMHDALNELDDVLLNLPNQ